MILAPVFLFFAALALLSLWSVRRARACGFEEEYFLGSRSLKGVVLAMTLTATYGSVSSFVSGPGIAWQLGLGWVVFAAPQIIAGFLLLGILGKKTALVSRALGAVTVTDLLRARYANPLFSTLATLSLLVFFTTMMVGQFVGGAAIFSEVTGLTNAEGLMLFGALTVFYTAFGGFRAVALTDTLCALLMVFGMCVLGGSIAAEAGGFAAALAKAAAASGNPGAYLSPDAGGALPWTLLLSAWVLVGFGTVGLPQSAVRCMSYRSTGDLHRALWVSTVVCGALMIGMTLLGVLARGVYDVPLEVLGSTDRLIPRLIAEHMHPVVAGLTLIGPVAATMSTVSSLLIGASSGLVRDLALHARPDWREARFAGRLAWGTRFVTLFLGAAAAFLALDPPDLVAWINLAAFGGLELTFLLPLGVGLFWRRANGAGCLASVVAGLAVYLGCFIAKPDLGGFHAVVPGTLAALAAFVTVSLATPSEDARRLRFFFPAD